MQTQGRKVATIKDYKPTEDRDVTLIDWPGVEGKQVGLMLLNCGEQQQAYFDARNRFAKQVQQVDDYGAEAFSHELLYQLLFRCLIDPDSKLPRDRIFRSVDQCRECINSEERDYFIRAYETFSVEITSPYNGVNGTLDVNLRKIAIALKLDPEQQTQQLVNDIVTRAAALTARG